MLQNRRKLFSVVGLIVAVGALAGCQDKLTYERFQMIRVDATMSHEVEHLLGEPTDILGNRWIYERPDDHLFAFVDYDEGGTVSRKQWYDAENEVLEDSNPEQEGDVRERMEIRRIDD